jgi:flavin reductase (DIM6/NTAB) family NADH-FMN oxidoreductase RutF
MTRRAFTAEEFRAALGRFATGVTVLTVARDDGRPHGMTVNAFASVSLEPPLVLVCLGRNALSATVIRARGRFGVSILRQEQEAASRYFAEANQDAESAERLGIRWRNTEQGTPLLEESLAQLECSLEATHDGGDHIIVVGRVEHIVVGDGRPLVYFRSRYSSLGETP